VVSSSSLAKEPLESCSHLRRTELKVRNSQHIRFSSVQSRRYESALKVSRRCVTGLILLLQRYVYIHGTSRAQYATFEPLAMMMMMMMMMMMDYINVRPKADE